MERSGTTDTGSEIAPVPPAAVAAEAARRPSIPSNFGKYEIITHLASGGMADIFLCRARGIQGFEKLAIIKRVRQDRAFDKKMVDLFLDEARLAASLQHPNIVQVFEFGIVDGSYFLAMQYVHGEDVHALLKRMRESGETLPLPEVLAIVVGVCQGLHYAHECEGLNGRALGIVHRDISPSNVLISYDGAVLITDFGIAKATSRSSETTTGTVRGKLAYMSPEQCRGLPLDRRSDIFAIGTLLHELSTGKPLFGATSDFDVMKAIVEDPVRAPSAQVPGYPSELDRIVLKALARDPAHRYASARELQLDIERFAVEHKMPISSARLAGLMQERFADRIAGWRERVALDGAARASMARPPSAEVEIVPAGATATVVDAPIAARTRKHSRVALIATAAAAAAIAVVAQRQLASSHAAAAPVATSAAAPASTAAAPASPSPTLTPPSVALPSPAAPIAATTSAPIASAPIASASPRHHRNTHRHVAKRAAAAPATAKAAPTQHPPADWNPEDGLPPGTTH
jgi:tRNA A-37 threonylcarbamoyl transferase component Bud32